MVYLQSLLFGIGGAVIASFVWCTVAFVLPLFAPMLIGRIRGTGGMSSAQIDSGSILIAALVGFIIGFAWEWYRLRAA